MSRQVEYGIELILALHKAKNEPLSLRMFSEESSISFLFLQKIAKQLREAGLIRASKGAHGGYTLVKPAGDITLKDVMEAIEGPFGVVACTRPGDRCTKDGRCLIQKGMEQLNAHMVAYLTATTVADMVSAPA